MIRHILNTWALCILFCIINTTFSASVALDKPQTIYEALVDKCPQLENIQLRENLNDIFNKKCSNWSEINVSSSPSKERRTETACLVLYESLLSFCTGFGDSITKYKNLIPTSTNIGNYSMTKICVNNELREALNNTEHNISNLLTVESCLFWCAEIGERQFVVNDICKFVYFFGTFDVRKFTENFRALNKSGDKIPNSNLPSHEDQPVIKNAPELKSDGTKGDSENANKVKNPPPEKERIQPDTVNLKKSELQPDQPQLDPAAQPNKEKHENISKVDEPPAVHNDGNLQNQLDNAKNQNIEDSSINKPALAVDQPLKIDKNETKVAASATKKEMAIEKSVEVNQENSQENIAVGGSVGGDQEESAGEDDEDLDNEAQLDHGKLEEADEKELFDKEQVDVTKQVKPANTETDQSAASIYNTPEDDMSGDSYFLSYFTVIMCLVIIGYVGYHNRQKILALLLEGKKGKRPGRHGRRPNSANYHKLDSNLEEAMSSQCTRNASNVIY